MTDEDWTHDEKVIANVLSLDLFGKKLIDVGPIHRRRFLMLARKCVTAVMPPNLREVK